MVRIQKSPAPPAPILFLEITVTFNKHFSDKIISPYSPAPRRFEKLQFCFRRIQKDRNENGNQDGMQYEIQDGMKTEVKME